MFMLCPDNHRLTIRQIVENKRTDLERDEERLAKAETETGAPK